MLLREDGDELWRDRDGRKGPKATVEAEDTEASFVPWTKATVEAEDTEASFVPRRNNE